jgi:hypothetical protein
MHRIPASATLQRRFSATLSQCSKGIFNGYIRSEPETRHGLSLARNDALATITRSMFLACPFASTQKTLRVLVRSRAPPLSSVSKPNRGTQRPGPVVRVYLPRSCDCYWSPLPFRSFPTFRIKAFNQSPRRKLALPDARSVFRSPTRVLSIALRIDARNFASSCLAIVP